MVNPNLAESNNKDNKESPVKEGCKYPRVKGPCEYLRLEGTDDNRYYSQVRLSRLEGPSPSEKPGTNLAAPNNVPLHLSGPTK